MIILLILLSIIHRSPPSPHPLPTLPRPPPPPIRALSRRETQPSSGPSPETLRNWSRSSTRCSSSRNPAGPTRPKPNRSDGTRDTRRPLRKLPRGLPVPVPKKKTRTLRANPYPQTLQASTPSFLWKRHEHSRLTCSFPRPSGLRPWKKGSQKPDPVNGTKSSKGPGSFQVSLRVPQLVGLFSGRLRFDTPRLDWKLGGKSQVLCLLLLFVGGGPLTPLPA